MLVTLGEKLLPIVDPLITGFRQFVIGLKGTEEGKQFMDDLTASVQGGAIWVGNLINNILNFGSMAMSAFRVAGDITQVFFAGIQMGFVELMASIGKGLDAGVDYFEGIFLDLEGAFKGAIADILKSILDSPIGKILGEQLGIDGSAVEALQKESDLLLKQGMDAKNNAGKTPGAYSQMVSDMFGVADISTFQDEMTKNYNAAFRELEQTSSNYMTAQNRFISGELAPIFQQGAGVIAAGAEKEAQERQKLDEYQQQTANQTFSSDIAEEEDRRAARDRARQRAAQFEGNAAGDGGGSATVRLRVIGNNRYRKARRT